MKVEYLSLDEINHWARMSCTRWNKRSGFFGKISRWWHREKYRKAAKRTCASPKHQVEVSRYKGGDYERNTYPWPYSAPRFADWSESDDPKDYSLISDQSGCVVKNATSYVAYKISELTGEWPERMVKKRYDAWDWLIFLAQAGYVDTTFEPLPGHHYVGILNDTAENRSLYEWGLVVWAEKIPDDGGPIKVSTYMDKAHKMLTVGADEYTWVEIPDPAAA